MTGKRDRLEDAIYTSPIGSTTPWRCKECGTAIARLGQPCKCTPELLEKEKQETKATHNHEFYWTRGHKLCAICFLSPEEAQTQDNPLTEELPVEVDTDLESHVTVGVKVKF